MTLRSSAAAGVSLLLAAAALPAQLLDEGFEDVSALTAAGWVLVNHSQPLGTTGWFQGNDEGFVFAAQAGSNDSFLAANYQNAAFVGTISNWALTPVVPLVEGDALRFLTRTVDDPADFPDRLQVRMSLAGPSSDVGATASDTGDFATLLLTVNAALTSVGYPAVWAEYQATVPALPKSGAMGRFAFRYYVTSSGPDGVNGDYIGIDSIAYDSGGVYFDDFESGGFAGWSQAAF
jgi:hypothetical protein